jgi:predicted NUDIX family NTP pyrophosphohydrolase
MARTRTSAGILLFRYGESGLEVLLGHMGGPLWASKDETAWTIPKGEYDPSAERPFDVALREFEEELGTAPPASKYLELGDVRQAGGKLVTIWAGEGDFDVESAVSNTFEMEWPKGSGRIRTYPEIDRAAWFSLDRARSKLVRAQVVFLDRLLAVLASTGSIPPPAIPDSESLP